MARFKSTNLRVFVLLFIIIVACVYYFFDKSDRNQLTSNQVEQFAKVAGQGDLYYQAIDSALNSSYVNLQNPKPQRYLAKTQVESIYKLVFTNINANQAPIIEDHQTLLFPGFVGFKFLVSTCEQARPHVAQLKQLTNAYADASSLCDLATAIDRVFLTGLTDEQINSLNTWALEDLIPEQVFTQAQDNKLGFTYRLPSLADYLKLPVFGKYVIQ
ncbi:hypothetical protein [Psittacicella gerlachiana]|uniref:Uncharacterized protein n=1 Tax=Psittacicella gerlachiana TaxID=2028574 RepID=A0A3A1YNE9_9GAMM|nr:hypothetical protein [Psittacicella gerlachiana]RIY38500.1 hypothetical protein CKF59_00760 [Psittacicella gerlachiana]